MNMTLRAPCVALLVALPLAAQAQLSVLKQSGYAAAGQTASTPEGITVSTSVAQSGTFAASGTRGTMTGSAYASSEISGNSITIGATSSWWYNGPSGTDAPSGGNASSSMSLSFSVLSDTPVQIDVFRTNDAGVPASTLTLMGPNGNMMPTLLSTPNGGLRATLLATLKPGVYAMSVAGGISNPGALWGRPSPYASANIKVSVVPEPASWVLMALGLGALGVARRRSK